MVFYLYLAGWTPEANAAILLVLAALVFVPISYVYPTRTPVWRVPTIVLGALWGLLVIAMLWQMPGVSRPMFWASMVFPVYYLLLSLGLDVRRRRAA